MLWSAKNLAKLTFPPPFFFQRLWNDITQPLGHQTHHQPQPDFNFNWPDLESGGFKLAVWMFRLAVPKNASKRLMGIFV